MAIPGGRSGLEELIAQKIAEWREQGESELQESADKHLPAAMGVASMRLHCADDLSALLTAAGSAPVTTHGHHFSDTTWAGQLQPPKRCPRCDSPSPELHPSVQWEGEVQPCSDPWHSQPTNRTSVAAPDMAWQNIDRALVHLPDDQLCGVWPDGSGLRGAHIKHLIAELRGAAVPAQAAPQHPNPVAWIVSASDSIPYPHIERLMDVGQFPSGTRLYADTPPVTAQAPAPTDLERYDAATIVRAKEREQEYRRTIWAAAAALWPNPLRVPQITRDAYTRSSELQTRTDPATGDLLLFAARPSLPVQE